MAKIEVGPEVIQADLLPLAVPIDSPILDPRNAREHPEENKDQIKLSLLKFGQCKPVVVNRNTGIIEAGNGMVEVARELGWKRIAVARADHNAADAMAYALMDNKSGLSSNWNLPALKDTLQELDTGAFEMKYTGFSETEIEELMTQYHTGAAGGVEDDYVPDVPKKAVSKIDDIYKLGVHRLICGDCTESSVIERLLDGEQANMLMTDPPYGINLVHGDGHVGGESRDVPSHKFRPVLGDEKRIDLNFLLVLAPAILIWGGNFYADILPAGGRAEEGVTRFHPNQKAVAVLSQIMQDFGKAGDLVLDPFGGSGSTLIACEKIGRRCYMVENDLLYCDIIVQRWEDYTHQKAARVGKG